MPPSNSKNNVEVISLLDDDSDVEAAATSIKRPSPTSVAASASMNGGETNKKKRRKGESTSPFVQSADAIDLLDDSEDEAPAVVAKMMNDEAPKEPAGVDTKPAPDVKPNVIGVAAAKAAIEQADSDVEEVEANASEWRSATGSGATCSAGTGNPKDDRAYDSDAAGGNGGQKKTLPPASADDDEEFEIVATKGQNALADFPHSRANCVTHPFASADKKTHCDNCYCYVCDMPAAECQVWDSHCKAYHEDRRWREERERFKRLGAEAALAPAAAPAAAAAASSTSQTAAANATTSSMSSIIRGRPWSRSARRPARSPPAAEFSVRKLLQMVTTVHPVEISPPSGSGFTSNLRHYQKQSLAFMVDLERASSEDNQKARGGWLADEVGMGKSAVVLALIATNPAAEADVASEQEVRDHASDISAHDHKRAASISAFQEQKNSEWDELERKSAASWSDDEYHRRRMRFNMQKNEERSQLLQSLKEKHNFDKIKLKTTVILTSVSLMGQWEDEIKKHAPGLAVRTFHSSRKKRANNIDLSAGHAGPTNRRIDEEGSTSANVCNADAMVALSEADVLISSSTFYWPKLVRKGFKFHRVVQDESHLFIKGGASAKLDAANLIQSTFRWGVTATPITSSIAGLLPQMSFIQGGMHTNQGADLRRAISSGTRSQEDFDRLVDRLGKLLIRHTKSQRINGSEALSLPPSTTSTVMLTMSNDEDRLFNRIHVSYGTFLKHVNSGVHAFSAEKCFGYPMGAVLRRMSHDNNRPNLFELATFKKGKNKYCYSPEHLTKIVALRKDLRDLRQNEPKLKAVVFTQFLEVHSACVRGLMADGYDVYEFTGSSDSVKRDAAIRNFQREGTDRPTVFVITLRSGNVGITLTAASRVYLLEPCLDPAIEVQAAGRIHRLGQDKPCHVVKFAFKNSYEANILKLHQEILAGRMELVNGFVAHDAMKILAKGISGGGVYQYEY